MLQREPWTYIITKVDNTTPKGIVTYTVKQDKYEPEHDYVQLNPDAPDYGDMYADYYSSIVVPKEEDENVLHKQYRLVVEALNYNVKLGYTKVLTAKIYDGQNNEITNVFKDSECIWNFKLENENLERKRLIVIDEEYSLKEENKFKCKFKFDGDEKYLGQNITATCQIDNMTTEVLLEIITL